MGNSVDRLKFLREKMKERNYDVYIIPKKNEFGVYK